MKMLDLVNKFFIVWKTEGAGVAIAKTRRKLFKHSVPMLPYDRWVALFDTIRDIECGEISFDITSFRLKPLVSIVMPVYNPNPSYLRLALDSVRAQYYQKWELCIADDASPNEEIREILKKYSRKDSRIKVIFREKNGHISAASNSALSLVRGEYIAFMDHDDAIPRHAIYEVVREINRAKGRVDLIYTDEDKIDRDNHRYDPYFKADWDPVMIYSQNFVAHLGVYRTSIVQEIGGFRQGFEGSQDYDLLLRFLKHTDDSRIRHIPHVLYHWRIFPGNHTFSTDNHDMSDRSAYRALQEHFSGQSGIEVEALPDFPGCWSVRRRLPENPPFVSIIIPTRDKADVLRRCVESILMKTQYANYEVLIADNGSQEPQVMKVYEEFQKDARVRLLHYDRPFNYSAINNFAAAAAKGELYLFLNNDTEVMRGDWLQNAVSSLQWPNAGIVGAKLYYSDMRVQHAGVALGIYGIASHIGRGTPRGQGGYFGWMSLERCVSAVTGACLLIKKDLFQKIGGFDERELQVSYNDVDLCLKVRQAGYHVIMNPAVELYHYESVSRGPDETPEQKDKNRRERHTLYQRYGRMLQYDPCYSPNLCLENENIEPASFPRVGKSWRSWVEFVCPFHRGDVLLGLQIAAVAWKHGIRLRMHVSEDILPWLLDFDLPFPVEPVNVKIPPAKETYLWFQRAEALVASRVDSSGRIIGSHNMFDFDFLGLDIVENMLHEFGLPIDTPLDSILPKKRQLAENDQAMLEGRTALLHPFGGWKLKSLSEEQQRSVIDILHRNGWRVVQIGGKGDLEIPGVDGTLLGNESLGWWRSVFEASGLLIGVDSWSSHMAAVCDIHQITFYGTTNARDVASRSHFVDRRTKALLVNTIVSCSPCHAFECEKGLDACAGVNIDETAITHFLREITC